MSQKQIIFSITPLCFFPKRSRVLRTAVLGVDAVESEKKKDLYEEELRPECDDRTTKINSKPREDSQMQDDFHLSE